MGNIFRFCVENFTHVAPILISGAVAIIIMLERYVALTKSYPMGNMDGFFERLRMLVMKDQINDAIALCERYRGKPVARIVREGLMRAHQPENLIQSGLEIVISESTERIQSRTAFLGTIANVATLFGLLGTIIGLVQSFQAVGSANAQQRSALLAQGISTAMNATMLGLGVAIPCMIVFAYLMSRTNKLVAEVEQSALRTLDILQQRYFSAIVALKNQDGTFTENLIRKKA
jgi:biopolymer transport protein ExbB/TolQ